MTAILGLKNSTYTPRNMVLNHTQEPHSHILLMDGGGRNFFGSEILSKRDFLGSIKDAGIFWFVKKTQSGILGKYVLFNSSNQQ